MHIPPPEYMRLYDYFVTMGEKHENVCCWALNTGFVSAMFEERTIDWVLAGHDHNNDYFGNYHGVNLSYGRKTGYGSYGPPKNMQKGARVFEITQDPWLVEFWIRNEDGSKEIQSKLHNPNPIKLLHQQECCSLEDHMQRY